MSTRQNKKQRKGRNANNRERTVTTLTADPNTHYLVPKLSEEPARPQPPPLPASSGSTAAQLLNMPMPQPYSMPANFPFGYPVPFASVQHATMQQQQHQQQPQHHQQQVYAASPQQISQPSPNMNLPPGKNDLEILQNLKKMIKDGQHPFYRAIPSPAALASLYAGPSVTQAQPEASRRRSSTPPIVSPSGDRRLGVDQKMADVKNGAATSRPHNAPSVAHLNIEALQISNKEGSAPPSTGPPRSSVPSDRLSMDVDVVQAVQNKAGAVQTGRSQTALKDATAVRGSISLSDSRVLASERAAIEPPNAVPSVTAPSSTQIADHKAIHTAAQKVFSPGREWYPNDRVVYERPVPDKRPSDPHRPTLDDAVSYSSVPGLKTSVPRAPIAQPAVPDKKPDVPAPAPREAAQTSIRAADDVRSADSAPALPILGPTSQPPPKAEPSAPQRQYPDQPSSDMDDVRSSRASSVQPPGASATLESVPPPSSAESLPLSTDNSGVAPPYLAERVEPETIVNPPAKPSAEPTANPVSPEQRSAPPPQHFGKKSKFQKAQHFPGPGKYVRPGPPVDGAPPGAGYPPRVTRPRTPSPDGRRPREYRGPPPPPARPLSRERASFRAEYDPRRPDILDTDIPPPHPRYEPRPYSPFPGGERRPSGYPITPPLSAGRGPPVDVPSGRPGDYYMYPPRDEWDLQEDEYYKARERGWDRAAFERDSYGRGPWDPRQDRDYVPRDAYPPGSPPPPPMPLDDRYPPGPAMPRDIDRGPPAPYGAPPYGRVRPRSPSPLGRGGHPPLEDLRPPMKRAREDFPPDYYQPGRAVPARRAPADYPPPPPPPSRGGPGAGGPPGEWPVAPGSASGNLPPRNRREYRPMEYAPPYERPPPGPPGRMPYGPEGDRTGYAPRPPQ